MHMRIKFNYILTLIQFTYLAILLEGVCCQAQNNPDIKRTMHWYFGYGAGLDFTSGSPVADTTGKSAGPEECFTMSDTCGYLLFYGAEDSTNSKLIIWTKNHTIMQNGILTSCCNPTQTVCVPQPGNDSLFYVFYTHQGGTLLGKLLYAIININKNNGYGEVISSDNVLIDSLSTEKAAATRHCNGIDYWIAGKDIGNWFPSANQLKVWLLTENGLNTTPIVSTPGNIGWENGDGYFRFSPDGSMAAVSYVSQTTFYIKDSSYFEIYKFNNCTGVFSNPITIQFPQPYGLSFSPDNSKLYVSCADGILYGGLDTAYIKQYDLSIYNQSDILASTVVIKKGPIGNTFQLGLNSKIYVAGFDTTIMNMGRNKIGIINDPNSNGTTCNYLPQQIDLIGKSLLYGLPYWPDNYFSSFNYTHCEADVVNAVPFQDKINIYPNPCTEFINIESEQLINCQISIKDIMGNTLLCKKTNETIETIDTKQLHTGIYFIQIKSNNHFINLKFLKQ